MEALKECEVLYYDREVEGTEKFKYLITHLPTGKQIEAAIWLLNRENGYKLLDWWNHCKDFKYSSIIE